ncbi:MAG TPA: host specificity factor TipJ family phage tail protein [Solimonas sp.]|nr:host specificity factor TipJ family phage tail protein [Solimonas sp.]
MGFFNTLRRRSGNWFFRSLDPGAWLSLRLYDSLIPEIPEVPQAIATSGRSYNVDLQQNRAQIGAVKAVAYGRWRDWPSYCSQPYVEYVNHQQVLHAYLHVTVGQANLKAVRVGTTPFSAFAGSSYEWLAPGDTMTLVAPDVYTCPDVDGVEVKGGAYNQVSPIYMTQFVSPNRINVADYGRFLTSFSAGATITVGASVGNDGARTVATTGISATNGIFSDGYMTFVENTVVNGAAELATLAYTQLASLTDCRTLQVTGQTITFDNTLSEIQGDDEAFVEFQVGDVVGCTSGLNASVDFEVLDATDSTLIVSPAPSAEAVATTIYLKRRRVGPYLACPPGAQCESIGVDLFFRNGLGKQDGGSILSRAVQFELRYRPVDDAGLPLGDWTVETFDCTDNSFEPRRFSQRITLSEPMRAQVDLCRLTAESSDDTYHDSVEWGGLRGYLVALDADQSGYDADCTRIAVKLRSGGQLSQVAQRSLNIEAQRVLPVYNGATWADEETSNPAWAAADWLVTQSRGRVTNDNLDLDKFVSQAAYWDGEADEFNGLFDAPVGYWEGARSILRVGRARPCLDTTTQLLTLQRDEVTAATLVLGDGINARFGADAIEAPTSETVSGVVVKFIDPFLWKEREGPVVGSDTDPREVSLMGCTSWQKAWEEANYQFNDARLRVHTLNIDTEMEGLLGQLGDRLLLASAKKGWGQAGEVTAYTGAGDRQLTVWPPPAWTTGAQHYVYLQNAVGGPGARINCTRGAGDEEIVLASDCDVTLRIDEGQRTVFAFGHDAVGEVPANGPRVGILEGASSDGLHAAQLQAVLEDESVHADPGAAPADPYALNGTAPSLAIENLDAVSDGATVDATWDAVDVGVYGDILYEVAYRYEGDIEWTIVQRGSSAAASFAATVNGTMEVRVTALSVDYIGAAATVSVDIGAGGGTLTATATPHPLTATGSAETVTSGNCYAVATGGDPGYTYLWTQVGGDWMEIVTPTASPTKFRALEMERGETRIGTFHCRVTDEVAATATTETIAVTLKRRGTPE